MKRTDLNLAILQSLLASPHVPSGGTLAQIAQAAVDLGEIIQPLRNRPVWKREKFASAEAYHRAKLEAIYVSEDGHNFAPPEFRSFGGEP